MSFITTQDLLNEALAQAGEVDSTKSSLTTVGLKYLNDAYLAVLSGNSKFDESIGDPFPWARDEVPGTLVLEAVYNTDTVSLTNGSKSGTFATAPTRSMRDRHLFVENRPEPYIISSHVAGSTSFTLQSAFIGDTQSYSFDAIKLIYDLGDEILRLVEPFRLYRNQIANDGTMKIWSLDINTLRRSFPLSRVRLEIPTYFATMNQKEDFYKIQFNSYVDEDTKVDFDKVSIPEPLTNDAGSIPLVPLQHRRILCYMTSAELLFNEKNDSRKGSIMVNLAKGMWMQMRQQANKEMKDTSRSRGRLIPRGDHYRERRFDDLLFSRD